MYYIHDKSESRQGPTGVGLPALTTSLPVASLPMYDWPEVRDATDALWSEIRLALRDEGVHAPDRLDRSSPEATSQSRESLLLGQTCGLPYVSHQYKSLQVVGSFHFDLECDPGDYHSLIVGRTSRPTSEPSNDVSVLRGSVVAYNQVGSQSGDAALRHLIAPLANGKPFLSDAIPSGSHRDSIRAVAEGRADFCCVDAVSWLLALDHEPAANNLQVLLATPPSPGLPLVTHEHNQAKLPALRRAIANATDRLDQESARILHLLGFRSRSSLDYDVLAQRAQQTIDLGYSELN